MQAYHLPFVFSPKNNESITIQAHYARNPTKTLVVFIHGFCGHPTKTWQEFDSLLTNTTNKTNNDLLFYGYDGLSTELNASAGFFRNFLDDILTNSSTKFPSSVVMNNKRRKNFQYDQVTIIAHSMGAVIARKGIIDATKLNLHWVNKISMIFYAPAHKGARVVKLIQEFSCFSFFTKFIIPLLTLRYPPIEQLKPDSTFLKELLFDTKSNTINNRNTFLRATSIFIAPHDKIVENDTFGEDPPADPLPGTNHKTICKPNKSFLLPLNKLKSFL